MEGEGEGVGRRGKREEERGASHLACALGLATWGSGPVYVPLKGAITLGKKS